MNQSTVRGTIAGTIVGLTVDASLALISSALFYRGYGETPANHSVQYALFAATCLGAVAISALIARATGGSSWLAGIATAAGLIPVSLAVAVGVLLAACSGHWFGHSCAFS